MTGHPTSTAATTATSTAAVAAAVVAATRLTRRRRSDSPDRSRTPPAKRPRVEQHTSDLIYDNGFYLAPPAVHDGQRFSQMQGRRHDSSRREQARLPLIAPRHGGAPPGPESSSNRASIPLPETSRSRLPPRSRSGCWTCRLRKVKCDEQRPTCGQCARLGHNCDYNPRLAFRDDTPRVIERMQEIRTTGSSVWDPDTKGVKYGPDGSKEDLLPAFATLRTDEEREKKAESKGPGTYLVVANPSSFASLPEYCEDESSTATLTPVNTSFEKHLYLGGSDGSQNISPIESDDPNIVILKTFEDSTPRTPFQLLPSVIPVSQTHVLQSVQLIEPPPPAYLSANLDVPMVSRIDEARHGGRDAQLLQHYRSTIAPNVILSGRPGVGEDPFERQARTFPPLFHAMMAVSALSLANRNNMHHADALEHYQQVIPAMRSTVQSSEDFASDGALFTHYLLLMYEIANSGNWQSNMWQHHCDRLFSIVTIRQEANGTEPYSYLAWMVALIDTYALLSGSGNGMYVEGIFKHNIVPPEGCLPPLAAGQTELFYREEMHCFPELLELNQQVVKLSARIGGVARDLRTEAAQRMAEDPMALGLEPAYLMIRQARIKSIHEMCRDLSNSWAALYPQLWPRYRGLDQLPYRARAILEHAQSLYMASVIYTYTNMYPSQIADREAEYEIDVPACATGIIEIARQIVTDERWDCRYITFGLFIAGFASTNPAEKALAFDLFGHIEQYCYGGNTTVMKQFLSTIYARQQEAAQSGRSLEIDWIEEMRVRSMKLVMFGM